MAAAMRASAPGRAAGRRSPASRSTPARSAPGEAFFAIQGESRDGHDFVAAALDKGAGLAVVSRRRRFPDRTRACSSSPMCSTALTDLGARRARALAGAHRRRHRLGRQDRHQGGAAPRARRRGRDACVGRLLQQSLGRAADARAHARERAIRRVRDRHEPCRRIDAADRAGAPARRDRHHDRAGASRILRLARSHRRRQGRDLRRHRAGRRRGPQPRQRQFERLARAARGGRRRRASSPSASMRAPMRGCIEASLQADCFDGRALRSSARGHLQARRARAGMSCSTRSPCWRPPSLLGADLALAALALAKLQPPAGRGARMQLALPGRRRAADRRKLQRQSGLDARRARAARRRRRSASAAGASRCSATCWNSGPKAPRCMPRSPARSRTTASISSSAPAR